MKKQELRSLTSLGKPADYEFLIALDIETSSSGILLDIGCTTESGHRVFENWSDCFTWILQFDGKVRVAAHNGFGFDFIGFTQWFLKSFTEFGIYEQDITFLSSESLIVAIIICKGESQYTLIDTMRYFPGQSLNSLAKDYLGDSKDDVPSEYISKMELFKELYLAKYYSYLEQDCSLLYKIYCKFREEINEFVEIGELGLSAGSTAMRAFRRWLDKVDPTLFVFSTPNEYLGAAEYALRGGLTLYIGDGAHKNHLYEEANHYDVISMYPSVMRSVAIPTSPMRSTKKLVVEFDRIRPGWYLADFEQKKGRVPIIFSLDSDYPVWSGQGLLSHYEVEFLSHFGKVKIQEGIIFEDYAYPFKDFLDGLLKLRIEAKQAGQTSKSHALKIIANSLYGKFSQSASHEVIAITGALDWYEDMIAAQIRARGQSDVIEYFYSNDLVLYGVQTEGTSFSNRFIGALVTSLARLKLGILYNTYPTIYCDTDSLFTQDTLSKIFIGEQPGDFEECIDSPNSLLCLGKKSYQYGETIAFKGIPKKSLSKEQLEQIQKGETVEVFYRSPTAFKTAIKKNLDRPNEFLSRSRRVKRGKSLAELGLLRSSEKLFRVEESKQMIDFLLGT